MSETQTTVLAQPWALDGASLGSRRRWRRRVVDAVPLQPPVLGLDDLRRRRPRPDSRLGESVHFFFYDVTKIALLLTGIIFVVTILRSFMSVERTRALLGGRREGVGNVAAAGLGVVTPFCSCSAVPVFIGFVAAGVPLGVTMSFLIASPMVNEVAIVMLFGLFGWEITALYIASGLVIAVVGRDGHRTSAARAMGRAVRVRDQAARQGHRPVAGARRGTTASRWAAKRSSPSSARSGPTSSSASASAPSSTAGLPEDWFADHATGPARRPDRRRDRRAAVLQRRRRAAARRGPARQGHADGHRARLHDERRRPLPARDDPAATGPASPS